MASVHLFCTFTRVISNAGHFLRVRFWWRQRLSHANFIHRQILAVDMSETDNELRPALPRLHLGCFIALLFIVGSDPRCFR